MGLYEKQKFMVFRAMRKRHLTEHIWLRPFGTLLKSSGWTLDTLGTIAAILLGQITIGENNDNLF